MLCEAGLPVVFIQEGGYHMGEIPNAAEALWARVAERSHLA